MKDYEQLYYDLLYENRKLIQKNKELEEEINMLKKYQKNGYLKDIIIKEICRRNKYENNGWNIFINISNCYVDLLSKIWFRWWR